MQSSAIYDGRAPVSPMKRQLARDDDAYRQLLAAQNKAVLVLSEDLSVIIDSLRQQVTLSRTALASGRPEQRTAALILLSELTSDEQRQFRQEELRNLPDTLEAEQRQKDQLIREIRELSSMERSRVRDAFRAIEDWQERAAYHYRTDLF